MRIIARKALKEFRKKHSDCEQEFKSRFAEIEISNFQNPNEVIISYPRASIISNDRIVFRIKGNKYRIICQINYDYKILRIRFIGTHAEYDKIDAKTVKIY